MNSLRVFTLISSLLIAFSTSAQSLVQSKTERVLQNVDTLRVDLTHHVVLKVNASKSDTLRVTTLQRGEYADALVLNLTQRSGSVLIEDPVSPNFAYPQDKLSAHKVDDNEVHLAVPRDVFVDITLRSADVLLNGDFKGCYLELLSGIAYITTETNATIKTLSADVFLTTSLPISCHTRNGTCDVNPTDTNGSTPKLTVRSVYGDVMMRNR